MLSRKTSQQLTCETTARKSKQSVISDIGRSWPVSQSRKPMKWYPARNRLITLVRTQSDSFVLPPALVKKAPWRD